jgi:type VI secretion system secreted protein Hcp
MPGGLSPQTVFLKLDGIKGESQDAKHKNEIELASFSWGVGQSAAPAGAGRGGAGKVQFTDLEVAGPVSRASPILFLACATGQHIKEGLLSVRKSGAKQVEYLKIKLTDILVTGYDQTRNDEDDRPLDVISFNFSKFEYSYYPQKADGSLDAPVTAGYDLKRNKKV